MKATSNITLRFLTSKRTLLAFFFVCIFYSSNLYGETFRFTALRLMEPHFFYDPLFYDCSDVTNDAPAIASSVNQKLQHSLFTDSDQNAISDFAIVLEVTKNEIILSQTECLISDLSKCSDDFVNSFTFSLENVDSGSCFDSEKEGADLSLDPKLANLEGPCFRSDEQDIQFKFVGTLVNLKNAKLFVKRDGKRVYGVLTGFISEESARDTDIDGDLLHTFLRGSGEVCASGDDRDTENGEKGWRFFLEFKASPSTLYSGEGCGGCSQKGDYSDVGILLFLVFLAILSRKRRLIRLKSE